MDSIREPSDYRMISSSELINLMMVNTLGMSMLIETFKAAAFYLSNSSKPASRLADARHWLSDMQEGRNSFVFINGTGLEVAIESYCLDYNADNLRTSFFYAMKRSTNGGH